MAVSAFHVSGSSLSFYSTHAKLPAKPASVGHRILQLNAFGSILAASNTYGIKFGRETPRLRRLQCKASHGTPGSTGDLTPQLKQALDTFIASHKVVLFMKGTKEFPQCGFSNTLVQILNSLNAEYETVNILDSDALRQGLKEYSSWPTFPQLYIGEAYKNGELQELLKAKSS
uniref:Glutaredoxin domain-containing protein n=1 Tax=Araucaria cunninghamii TaxID=56994 RepID=A0A0D6R7W6_ARACU